MTTKKEVKLIISDDAIVQQIYIIRGQKIMLDRDLALLYRVQTKVLKQAVKRHIKRFPIDFMFELSQNEYESLRSQFVTSKIGRGGDRYLPMAFTEQGVAMLSSILNSDKAVEVNIQIIRVFTKMRQMLTDTTEVKLEVEKIKKKLDSHGKNIELVFQYLDELLKKRENAKPRKQIGYKVRK